MNMKNELATVKEAIKQYYAAVSAEFAAFTKNDLAMVAAWDQLYMQVNNAKTKPEKVDLLKAFATQYSIADIGEKFREYSRIAPHLHCAWELNGVQKPI
jgi:hypothetical protein